MSSINQTVNQNQFVSNIGFPQRFGISIREYLKNIIQPLNMLKSMGIGLPSDEILVTSLVKSKLFNLPEVKDFDRFKENNALNLFAYIDQPNEEVENKIYSIYGEMLDLFPNIDIDLRIVELYGRTKEEIKSYNL